MGQTDRFWVSVAVCGLALVGFIAAGLFLLGDDETSLDDAGPVEALADADGLADLGGEDDESATESTGESANGESAAATAAGGKSSYAV